MNIWKIQPSIDQLNNWPQKSMANHLDIEIIEVGEDYMIGRMPVTEKTRQPFGLLHGGASCVLAETLGSIASTLTIDLNTHRAVGLEINANHIRSAKEGFVYGKVQPVHVGKSTQVWEIRITDEQQKLICISRLTMAIIVA